MREAKKLLGSDIFSKKITILRLVNDNYFKITK